MKGEMHLLIVPNEEHAMITSLPEVLTTLSCFLLSIAEGHTEQQRPYFNYTYNNSTGEITATIPSTLITKVDHVVLHWGETLQTVRRDFRWVF